MHNLNLAQLQHHAAIGGVALKWTHLESYVQSILWRISGLDPTTGRCITHHMPFRSVCDAIVTIAHERREFQTFAPELERLFSECDQLRVKRNDTVHALWATFLSPKEEGKENVRTIRPGEVEDMVIKARGRLKITINSTTVAQIDDIIEEVKGLLSTLREGWAQEAEQVKNGGQAAAGGAR